MKGLELFHSILSGHTSLIIPLASSLKAIWNDFLNVNDLVILSRGTVSHQEMVLSNWSAKCCGCRSARNTLFVASQVFLDFVIHLRHSRPISMTSKLCSMSVCCFAIRIKDFPYLIARLIVLFVFGVSRVWWSPQLVIN